MTPSDFVDQIVSACSVHDVMTAYSDLARSLGATSASFGFVRGGVKQRGWSSTPDAWRRRYHEEGLGVGDPEFVRETRLPGPAAIRFADGYPGCADRPPTQRLYEEVRAFGFSGGLFLPDLSPCGQAEMATVNVMTDLPDRGFRHWAVNEGARLALMGAAVLTRLRDLRPEPVVGLRPSPRELEVLRLLADGHRTARIAELLGISDKTVEFHITNVRQKLGTRTREATLAKAIRSGLL